MRENNLTTSTLVPGQPYQIPSGDFSPGDAALGQATLNADNSRIAALQAAAVQASMASAPADSFSGALYLAEQTGQSMDQILASQQTNSPQSDSTRPSGESRGEATDAAGRIIDNFNTGNDLSKQVLTFAAKEALVTTGIAGGSSQSYLTSISNATEVGAEELGSLAESGVLKYLNIGLKITTVGTVLGGAAEVVHDVYKAPDDQKIATVVGDVGNTAVQTGVVTAGATTTGYLAGIGAGILVGGETGDLASGVATPASLVAVPVGAVIGGVAAALGYKATGADEAVKSFFKGVYNASTQPVDGEAYDYFLQNGGGI